VLARDQTNGEMPFIIFIHMAISAKRHAGKPSLVILALAILLLVLIFGATIWYFNDDSGDMAPGPAVEQVD
jgi:hypothetical protein